MVGKTKKLDQRVDVVLSGILKMKMMEHKEYFDRLDTLKVNEDLRPEKLINDDFLGFYGTFKHLDID
jgi:hypothetical protein